MLFEEYAYLVASETHFSENTEEAFEAEKDKLIGFNRSTKEIFEKELKTNAIKDAKAVEGSFPVVVYAPSIEAPSFENSVLCEFLASHGYIVIASQVWA